MGWKIQNATPKVWVDLPAKAYEDSYHGGTQVITFLAIGRALKTWRYFEIITWKSMKKS